MTSCWPGSAPAPSMTIRLYADFKKIPLERVYGAAHPQQSARQADCENCETNQQCRSHRPRHHTRRPAGSDQRKKLMDIADKCPVHQTLESKIRSGLSNGRRLEFHAVGCNFGSAMHKEKAAEALTQQFLAWVAERRATMPTRMPGAKVARISRSGRMRSRTDWCVSKMVVPCKNRRSFLPSAEGGDRQ